MATIQKKYAYPCTYILYKPFIKAYIYVHNNKEIYNNYIYP